MSSTFASIPIQHAVTIRLSKTNYNMWRAQFLPYLRSCDLLGHVDGTLEAPPKVIVSSTTSGASQVPNPAYTAWFRNDQHVLSGILASLTEDIFEDVMFATTAEAAWSTLARQFAAQTRAQATDLRMQLASLKKKPDQSASDYYRKVKALASQVKAVGKPLHDDEVITYLLTGLGAAYDSFIQSMTTMYPEPSLDDVYAHLVAYEHRNERYSSEPPPLNASSANFAGRQQQRTSSGGGGRDQGGSSRGGRPQQRTSSGGGANRGQGRSQPQGSRGGGYSSSGSGRPRCQICFKEGHTSNICWHRYDKNYQPPQAAVATSSYQVDTDWYTDTGATDHITSDLDRLTMRKKYQGGEQVQVGNGQGSGVEEKAPRRSM